MKSQTGGAHCRHDPISVVLHLNTSTKPSARDVELGGKRHHCPRAAVSNTAIVLPQSEVSCRAVGGHWALTLDPLSAVAFPTGPHSPEGLDRKMVRGSAYSNKVVEKRELAVCLKDRNAEAHANLTGLSAVADRWRR